MGRPYAEEIYRLAETYAWATSVPLGPLPSAMQVSASLPLLAVGSGGSYTTALLASEIHRRYSSNHATVMTPLEAVSTPQSLRQIGVLLVTAGGKNPDVIGAFERLVYREPKQFLVLCTKEGSPLSRHAAKHPHVNFAQFEPPSGKDGFLATNSLLASFVLLIRAYAAAFNQLTPLPQSLNELIYNTPSLMADDIHERCRPLWLRHNLVVLYGPSCKAAAVDLESKFIEAALGTVQLADFRNFAHGRHHWLAKRGRETSVLVLVSSEDDCLADAMIDLLPKNIPLVRLNAVGEGIIAGLSALLQNFMVVGSAGRSRGVDPGNPSVPHFGRKIYNFRAFTGSGMLPDAISSDEAAAIERKSGSSIATHLARCTLEQWRASYRNFHARLLQERFFGVVLDYDGTLCDETERFDPLPAAVGHELNRLLRIGIVIGVATGRGKSVKATLRQVIRSRYWKRVIVGYYNGGDVASLADDTRPDSTEKVVAALHSVISHLKKSIDPEAATVTLRLPQITIEPVSVGYVDELWNLVQHLIFTVGIPGVTAVRSSHSIDVIAPGVSKTTVVDRVRQMAGDEKDASILCIGDRGLWPGNDYSLLSTPHSLSVDEVSPDPNSCWNLAQPGRRGLLATLYYLDRLQADGNRVKLIL